MTTDPVAAQAEVLRGMCIGGGGVIGCGRCLFCDTASLLDRLAYEAGRYRDAVDALTQRGADNIRLMNENSLMRELLARFVEYSGFCEYRDRDAPNVCTTHHSDLFGICDRRKAETLIGNAR